MCKRISDETREAILSGLEALIRGAEKITIPIEGKTIFWKQLEPGKFELWIIPKEEHKVGPNSPAYRKGMAGGRPEIKIQGSFPRRAEKDRRIENGRRMSGLKDRRAAITERRIMFGCMEDRKNGEKDFLERTGFTRRSGIADRRIMPEGVVHTCRKPLDGEWTNRIGPGSWKDRKDPENDPADPRREGGDRRLGQVVGTIWGGRRVKGRRVQEELRSNAPGRRVGVVERRSGEDRRIIPFLKNLDAKACSHL